MHLLAELRAQGVDDPQTRILAVTFTIDAAAEMRTRIQKYLGAERLDDEAAICNFHRFCNTLLQRHALAIACRPAFGFFRVSNCAY